MTVNELGKTLQAMYANAEKGEKVTMIHLFGVKYAQEIREAGAAAKDIAGAAGIPLSYGTEISKGVRLGRPRFRSSVCIQKWNRRDNRVWQEQAARLECPIVYFAFWAFSR